MKSLGYFQSSAPADERNWHYCAKPSVELSIVEQLNDSLAHNLNQLVRVTPGNVTVRGRLKHSGHYFAVAPPNAKFVSYFDNMSGFGWSSVQKHKARVAKLLG
jgi:hypothetical protein